MIPEKEHRKPRKATRFDYVRGLLIMNRIDRAAIAQKLGVSYSCVTKVVSGRGKSRRVMQAIADALDMSFEELWGKDA